MDSTFMGVYLARVMGTKVFPKEPVPPVTKIVLLVSMLSSKEKSKKVLHLVIYIYNALPEQAGRGK